MSNGDLENCKRSPAERFLMLLKKRGPQTANELGCATGVCGEAARQQLQRLAGDGLVSATAEPRGVGRPTQVWSLTPAGNAKFPDGHAQLTAQLIAAVRAEFGDDALDRLIDRRAQEAKATYAKAVGGATTLGDRVARLAAARTAEGYMAEVVSDDSGSGGYTLVENHCPICVAASACQSFCRAELETFREVLGPNVRVERTAHIVHGDRRCVYRITPASRDAAPGAADLSGSRSSVASCATDAPRR
jgi:predicted ArsR family transcriptional regulator